MVRSELLMASGTATVGDYYASKVATLGLEIQNARVLSADRRLVAESLDRQRESVSGVSLDEEAAKLIQLEATKARYDAQLAQIEMA